MTRTDLSPTMIIQSTHNTPSIYLDKESGILKIFGRCTPSDPPTFFNPIIEWLKCYAENPAKSTTVEFYLKKFDNSTSKYLFEILRNLSPIIYTGKKFNVKWHYARGNEDTLKLIEKISDELKIRFDLEEVLE